MPKKKPSNRGGRREGAGAKKKLITVSTINFQADAETLARIDLWRSNNLVEGKDGPKEPSRADSVRKMLAVYPISAK